MSSNIEEILSVVAWEIDYHPDGSLISVETESGHRFTMLIEKFVELADNCVGLEHLLDTGEGWNIDHPDEDVLEEI